MPIYEYRCRGCGAEFEKYVHGAAAAVTCPKCESRKVTRTLSVFGLRSDSGFAPSVAPSAGGCCGGGCSCH